MGTGGSITGLPEAVRARVQLGVEERTRVPLESLGEVGVGEDRPDPVELLIGQDRTRLHLLVPIRHQRMAATPFTFFRGGAAIMASDLSRAPSTGLRAQLCGDAHLSNFGVFNGADKRLVFDVNDFDETSPGPFEWDVKRLAASVTIAGRNNELSAKKTRAATTEAVRGYREVLAQTLDRSPMDLRYFRIDVSSLLDQDEKLRMRSAKAVDKASSKDSLRALKKLTTVVDGQRRIVSQPPLIVRLSDVVTDPDDVDRDRLVEFFDRYRASLPPYRAVVLDRYHLVDMAHKVVGVGSVGLRAFVVVLQSRRTGEPLLLQVKEASASVLEPFLGASMYDEPGRRVVEGQRMMQAASDLFLGWGPSSSGDRHYYWRQLRDMKGSAEIERMSPAGLDAYARICGWSLARAHARSGPAAAIAAYLGSSDRFERAMAEFAHRYSQQNRADFGAHQQAVADGRIEVAVDA